MSKQQDYLRTEQEDSGLMFTSTKRSIFSLMEDKPWTGCMWHCYHYLSFHIDARRGITHSVTIADLVDETPYKRSHVYNAIKALKHCGAIVQMPGKDSKYHLPHFCTTAERHEARKSKGKPAAAPKPADKPKQTADEFFESLSSESAAQAASTKTSAPHNGPDPDMKKRVSAITDGLRARWKAQEQGGA